jgi:hypothetical protein
MRSVSMTGQVVPIVTHRGLWLATAPRLIIYMVSIQSRRVFSLQCLRSSLLPYCLTVSVAMLAAGHGMFPPSAAHDTSPGYGFLPQTTKPGMYACVRGSPR